MSIFGKIPRSGCELTDFLARTTDGNVVVVEHYAHLVHEPDLLLVVTVERMVVGGRVVFAADQGGVDFGEEAQNVFGRDARLLGDGNGAAHVDGRRWMGRTGNIWENNEGSEFWWGAFLDKAGGTPSEWTLRLPPAYLRLPASCGSVRGTCTIKITYRADIRVLPDTVRLVAYIFHGVH